MLPRRPPLGLTFATLLWITAFFSPFGCGGLKPSSLSKPSVAIEVSVDEPISTFKGLPWPQEDGAPSRFCDVYEPAMVTVNYGGPKPFKTFSKLTSIWAVEDEKVTFVTMSPLPEALPYNKVLDSLIHIAQELGVADEPCFTVRFNHEDTPGRRSGRCLLSSKATVFFETDTNDGKVWFCRVTIAQVPDFYKKEQPWFDWHKKRGIPIEGEPTKK